MPSSPQPEYRTLPAVLRSAAVVAVAAGIANALLALLGSAAGASDGVGLQPVAFVTLTVVAAVGGAVGWHLVNRFSARPSRVMRWLVPAFLVVSFVPDVLVGASEGTAAGWTYALVLMAMHVATIAIAVPVYRRFLPLTDDASARVPERAVR